MFFPNPTYPQQFTFAFRYYEYSWDRPFNVGTFVYYSNLIKVRIKCVPIKFVNFIDSRYFAGDHH